MGSLAPKDATQGGIGIQEGDVRVLDAAFCIHQFPPKKETGEQADPFPALRLKLGLLVDGKLDGDPDTHYWRLGKLGKFAPSEDGEDAVGEDVGDEGPFYVSMRNGRADTNGPGPDKRSGVITLATSLLQCGFKEAILEKGDARDLVGMEGHVTQKKFSGAGINDYQVTVFDKISLRPYEQKGKKKAKAEAEEEEPAPKKKKAAAAEEDSGDEGEGSGDKAVRERLAAILKKLQKKIADAEGEMTVKDLRKSVYARVVTDPPAEMKAVMALFDDGEELEALGEAAGFKVTKKGMVVAEE